MGGDYIFRGCILNFAGEYYFSLGYGQDIPPLCLLCVSKPSYHRYHITPYRDRTPLLGMWTTINPADASENSGQ